jgi:hypothetical protein
VIGAVPASELPSAAIAAGCWDPHTPGVVALVAGTSVSVLDTRSMKRGLVNAAAHVMPARDVQFNPKRPHALVTCGDGCKIKVWDTRSMVAPLLELSGHTHWVWQARYNPFHDQLILVRPRCVRRVCARVSVCVALHLCAVALTRRTARHRARAPAATRRWRCGRRSPSPPWRGRSTRRRRQRPAAPALARSRRRTAA